MKTNKLKWIALLVVVLSGLVFMFGMKRGPKTENSRKEIHVVVADIEKIVTATGVVQPQNRLEMKPPVSGRVDEVLVREGVQVKAGDVVARMSSSERAALLDAARSKGSQEMAYWEDIYRSIPLIAPIDGQVIVSTMQPGQTVTQADPIIVLSDKLIVQAQIDETDIGRVKEGQEAELSLDAYPDVQVGGTVGHIYHESKIVNNVTIYQVDILPAEIPKVFRSGMSANVRIVESAKEGVLTLPVEAVKKKDGESFTLVAAGKGLKAEKRAIETGLSDDVNIEIVSGVDENDVVVIETKKVTKPKAAGGSSPFTPQPRRGGQGR